MEAEVFRVLEEATLKCLCIELEETRGVFDEQGKLGRIDSLEVYIRTKSRFGYYGRMKKGAGSGLRRAEGTPERFFVMVESKL